MAGKDVSVFYSLIANKPEAKFETPDTKIVTEIDQRHPESQCRLDTVFQAALCDVSMHEDVSATDEVKGTCHSFLGHNDHFVGLSLLGN